jgi:hypothetical protein
MPRMPPNLARIACAVEGRRDRGMANAMRARLRRPLLK